MSRRVRWLLLLGVACGGLWMLRRVLIDRSEHRSWLSPGPPRLVAGRQTPALPPAPPISDLDAFRAERAVATPAGGEVGGPPIGDPAVPAEEPGLAVYDPGLHPAPAAEAEVPPGPAEPGNLDKVRQRLASIHVDLPPVRGLTASAEVGASVRSRRSRRTKRWQEPAPDGTCDQSYPIKVKVSSGRFHLPGMFAYERTRADRCYRSSADAEADGFERAQR
ncbi:MAG: hypothetical protein ACR2MN_17725 [Acidimicrobiales bacterium]